MSAPAVLLCVVIVLFLIAQIRVGCKAEYDQEGVRVFVRAAGFHICVFPVKKKEKKQKPKKAKKPKKEKKAKEPVPMKERKTRKNTISANTAMWQRICGSGRTDKIQGEHK